MRAIDYIEYALDYGLSEDGEDIIDQVLNDAEVRKADTVTTVLNLEKILNFCDIVKRNGKFKLSKTTKIIHLIGINYEQEFTKQELAEYIKTLIIDEEEKQK